MTEHAQAISSSDSDARRGFLTTTSGLAMAGGLAAAYGTFGTMLAEFVYPAKPPERGWLFVCTLERLGPGESLDFVTPAGAKIVVARQGDGTTDGDFLALSSVCPHLGCRVHWEPLENRFFCPCHNGAFDRAGKPLAGPPKAADQALIRYPVKIDGGMLYVEAALTSLVARDASSTADAEGVA